MIVFGAGKDLENYLEKYSLHKHIEVVIDSNINKVGTNICGIKICGPEYLNKLRSAERIYISSSKYYQEIYDFIKAMHPELVALKLSDLFYEKYATKNVPKRMYNHARIEKEVYKEFEIDYTRYDSAFWERYKALTSNLDSDSIDTINTILKRLALLFSSEKENLDIWNKRELCELENIDEKLHDKICSFGDNMFIYKEFKLPKKYFDNGIYYYYYAIPMLSNVEKAFAGDVIDCGAFIGDSSLLFSKYTKKKVFAIEAQEENIEYIKCTMEINDVKNIVPVNVGISDDVGMANVFGHESSNFGTLMPYEGRDYKCKDLIQTDTIDSIVEKYDISPSFIKADIEGSESAMIRGAIKTLSKYKPALVICIHHTSNDFWGIKPFIESLDLGYSFKVYKKIDGNILTGTWLIAEVK